MVSDGKQRETWRKTVESKKVFQIRNPCDPQVIQ